MYTSYKTFTIRCPEGETGPAVTKPAAGESVISQWDADNKAFGLARRLAYEFLICIFPPTPETPIFCSVPVTKTAHSEPGYVPQDFTVSYGACDFYSTESQAAADAGAALAAQLEANHYRDINQTLIFYNTVQSYSSSCVEIAGPNHDPLVYTTTVAAGEYISHTSQAGADLLARNVAKANTIAVLESTCVPFWYSGPVTYTASCTPPEVGTAITITYAPGEYKSYVSQADADAQVLAKATTAANLLLVCITGFYNETQSAVATCLASYGSNWIGSDSYATIPAGTYFNSTLGAANTAALTAAQQLAYNNLICYWGGGIEP